MGLLQNGILLSSKKEENFTLCNSMDEPGEHYMLSEIRQSEKENTIRFHLYVEPNKKYFDKGKEKSNFGL